MKIEILTMRVSDGKSDWRISTEDGEGDALPPGQYVVRDRDDGSVVVTADALRGLLRAAEAAQTGVLLDDPKPKG